VLVEADLTQPQAPALDPSRQPMLWTIRSQHSEGALGLQLQPAGGYAHCAVRVKGSTSSPTGSGAVLIATLLKVLPETVTLITCFISSM
jgi:hypothetical protein